MLSIWVLKLNVSVDPTDDPCRRPTRTKVASAGRKNRLVKSTLRNSVDRGDMETKSPLGTQKSRESNPAIRTWYTSVLPLGLLNFTCSNVNLELTERQTYMNNIRCSLQVLMGATQKFWCHNWSRFKMMVNFRQQDRHSISSGLYSLLVVVGIPSLNPTTLQELYIESPA